MQEVPNWKFNILPVEATKQGGQEIGVVLIPWQPANQNLSHNQCTQIQEKNLGTTNHKQPMRLPQIRPLFKLQPI